MLGDLYGDVVTIIKNWNPKKSLTHDQCRNALAKLLRKELKNTSPFGMGMQQEPQVRKEYGRDSPCDVVVNKKIAIEIKKNFKSKPQVDRCYGQIVDYVNEFGDVIILLIGKTGGEALERLRERINRIRNQASFTLNRPRIQIIRKDSGSQNRSNGRRSGGFGDFGGNFIKSPFDW